MGMLLAKATSWLAGTTVAKMDFQALDMRDEDGLNVRLRILYHDLTEVQQMALEGPEYGRIAGAIPNDDLLSLSLAKAIATSSLGRTTMTRTLLLVQVCAAKTTAGSEDSSTRLLFMERRPWGDAISRYAAKYGLTVRFVSPTNSLSAKVRGKLPRNFRDTLRSFRYGGPASLLAKKSKTAPASPVESRLEQTPKIAAEHYGQLNLGDPALHSDLFFWQESQIQGSDVMLTFGSTAAVLDEPKLRSMQQHGIGAVVSHPGATSIPGYYQKRSHRESANKRDYTGLAPDGGLESQWLKKQTDNYLDTRAHWTGLFSENNSKVFLSWYKNDTSHVAVADAIRSLGGVAAIYQRSTEFHPSAVTTTAADIIFAYSKLESDVFRLSDSSARYYVATGYLGDHRFELLRERALVLRERLQTNGAERILALFDESYRADSRWGSGFNHVRNTYSFFLQKVIDDPWFGLVIKPKNPARIRGWLGPVAELLDRAESTGRCYIYEETDGIQGAHPPAAAALSADVTLHDHLWPGTAGMEAALAGIPSLLLDYSGWAESPLYQLGEGKVVFTSLAELWETCLDHWSPSGPVPGFGDWTPLLDELDPFRDGRAAERMGGYVSHLLDGFRDGLDRDTVMEDAAQRYADQWGNDKIFEVNVESFAHQT
jgi:hypothetical protein